MSQTVSLIRSTDLSDVAQYAYAAAAPAEARLIFFAGACPLDLDGSIVGVGDYAAQTGKAMENLALALKAAGARIDDVLSTLMGVTDLGYTNQLVEIEAVAAVIVHADG